MNYRRAVSCVIGCALSCAFSACQPPLTSAPDLRDPHWTKKHNFRSVSQDQWTLEVWMTAEVYFLYGPLGVAIRLSAPVETAIDTADVRLRVTERISGKEIQEEHRFVHLRCEHKKEVVVAEGRIGDAFAGDDHVPLGDYLLEVEVVTNDGTHLSVNGMPFKIQRYGRPN